MMILLKYKGKNAGDGGGTGFQVGEPQRLFILHTTELL